MPDNLTTVNISKQPIELCKLLKIANMVSGGGEAKIIISEGLVYLNGEVEFQKRKKIIENDIVEFDGEAITVKVNPTKKMSENMKVKTNNKQKPTSKKEYDNTILEIPLTKAKRKPISF